jgi:hypothetical protein
MKSASHVRIKEQVGEKIVTGNFLVESECVVLQNKICPFLRQDICIYFDHS